MNPSGHATIDLAAAAFAELLSRYCGEVVIGLHLVGSAADGDFRAGRSDLDFVAVLARPLTSEEQEALHLVHRSYGSDPTFPRLDGIWLTEPELLAGPDAVPDGPTSSEGDFFEAAQGNRNPVTWFALQHAISMFGTLPEEGLWLDRERLRSWVRENAATYWRRWYKRASGWSGPGLRMLGRAEPMWGVLGTARQHYTVTTGEIASKSTAGGWALETFEDRYRKIVEEALAYRRGDRSLYGNPLARRRDALGFVEMAIKRIVEA